MPVTQPAGPRPGPVQFDPVGVLTANRALSYSVDLLDSDEGELGALDGVSGGELSWQYNAAVKGGGTVEVVDTGQAVDWLNVRLRPVITIEPAGGEGDPVVAPLGVFLPVARTEQWDDLGRTWSLDVQDKLSILDTGIVTDVDGYPLTYSLPAGRDVLVEVRALIEGAGESAAAITPESGQILSSAMSWELGTSRLKIVNDLLAAGGFASLWCDGAGQYRAESYVAPSQRVPVYESLAAFEVGARSLIAPEWSRAADDLGVPNLYIAISQGDGEERGMVAVVRNDDEDSPYSYQARGRWIPHVEVGVDATSEEALYSRVLMGMSQRTSVVSQIEIEHDFLPRVRVNEVLRFVHADPDLDLLCYVTATSVPLEVDGVGRCRSEIREAIL